MVHLDSETYHETIGIIRGKTRLPPIKQALAEWLKECYGVRMLNFRFSKLETDGNRHRLYIVLNSDDDYNRMFREPYIPDETRQDQIAMKFRELNERYGYTDTANTENFFVMYNNFSDEAKTDANWKTVKNAAEALKHKYREIWHIEALFSKTVVFYYLDEDISRNGKSGLSGKIQSEYYGLLKANDDLNLFNEDEFTVRFDSKENLDRNYEGSLFYYSR